MLSLTSRERPGYLENVNKVINSYLTPKHKLTNW